MTILKNWRTSLGALLVAVGLFGTQFGLNSEQTKWIAGIGTVWGLTRAKDDKVTGGNIPQ